MDFVQNCRLRSFSDGVHLDSRVNYTLYHCYFIPISLRYHCDIIAIAFLSHCDIIVILLLFHSYFIVISFLPNAVSGSRVHFQIWKI
jgi:hypothetical protein